MVKQTVVVVLLVIFSVTVQAQAIQDETQPGKSMVVLLHGLARSSSSMNKMQEALDKEGFETCNVDYPSTRHHIAELATDYIVPKILECTNGSIAPINFVTHSMGGIIVRYLAKEGLISLMGRVVMLSPPNHGSEVVDVLGSSWLFNWVNGPAGNELGTDGNSMPLQLGPPDFDVGIITGNKSINLINSAMIDGADDGKVSVENAKLDGMKDFLVLPVTHTFIMKDKTVIKQTIHFLESGKFIKPVASSN